MGRKRCGFPKSFISGLSISIIARVLINFLIGLGQFLGSPTYRPYGAKKGVLSFYKHSAPTGLRVGASVFIFLRVGFVFETLRKSRRLQKIEIDLHCLYERRNELRYYEPGYFSSQRLRKSRMLQKKDLDLHYLYERRNELRYYEPGYF